MRTSLLLVCLLVPAVALAEDPPKSAQIGLEGVPAVVNQPVGEWDQVTDSPAEGQWYLEYTDADRQAVMRAYVFPAGKTTDPAQALVQAVDVFFRGLRVEGFGLPTRRALDVWGCPGAEGTIAAGVRGERVTGRARLVYVTPERWAFAIGYARPGASTAKKDAVHLFVGSLEPITPRFYTRTFHRPEDHATVVVEKEGETPVTVAMMAAAEAVLEAGIGSRFPIGLKPDVQRALRADARDGPPKTRLGYRDCLVIIRKALGQSPSERETTMNMFGKTVIHAILQRAAQQYPPAVQFALAWREHRLLSIGEPDDGLTGGDVANGIEMSEFLASIASDHEITTGAKLRAHLHGRLAARWKTLAADARAEGRDWDDVWAALRYAWDSATEAKRLAFRVAVVTRLTQSADPGGKVGELRDARALMKWMQARPREGLDVRLLDAAFDLTNAERRRLIEVLGVKDPYGFHFGW